MTRIALMAGSFDPITNGHLDVFKQALGLADEIVVAIGVHPGKSPLFDAEERGRLIEDVFATAIESDFQKLRVIRFDGLVVDAARSAGATMMIRGLRDATDFNYEMQMAGMNFTMAPEIRTVFLPASPGNAHVTGTLVRQIAKMGGDVTPFVPPIVAKALASRLQ